MAFRSWKDHFETFSSDRNLTVMTLTCKFVVRGEVRREEYQSVSAGRRRCRAILGAAGESKNSTLVHLPLTPGWNYGGPLSSLKGCQRKDLKILDSI